MAKKILYNGNLYVGIKHRDKEVEITETATGLNIKFLKPETKKEDKVSTPEVKQEVSDKLPWETEAGQEDSSLVKDPYEGLNFKQRLALMNKKEKVAKSFCGA